MITGHGTKSLKQKAESLGAAVFLEKPFRPTELKEVVATLLKQDTDEHDVA
jgi:FixJ family two-component response regulator